VPAACVFIGLFAITSALHTLLRCQVVGFRTVAARKSHEQEHDFERRQCDVCIDGKWYNTPRQWNNHKSTYHSNEWDPSTICGVKGCARGDVPFKTRNSYQQHIRDTHKLSGKEVARYVSVSADRAFTWGKRKCPIDDCSYQAKKKWDMETHLKTNAKKYGHYQIGRSRTWVMIFLALGGYCESIGYISHILSSNQAPNFTIGPYLLMKMLTLLAPALSAATTYMCLGRIVRATGGERYSLVRPSLLTRVFVASDITGLAVQRAGAGYIAAAC
jgi:hypothetical protein